MKGWYSNKQLKQTEVSTHYGLRRSYIHLNSDKLQTIPFKNATVIPTVSNWIVQKVKKLHLLLIFFNLFSVEREKIVNKWIFWHFLCHNCYLLYLIYCKLINNLLFTYIECMFICYSSLALWWKKDENQIAQSEVFLNRLALMQNKCFYVIFLPSYKKHEFWSVSLKDKKTWFSILCQGDKLLLIKKLIMIILVTILCFNKKLHISYIQIYKH